MQTVLVATDADEVFEEIDAALGGASTDVVRVRSGRDLRRQVIESDPDLVVIDLQIGSMGGVAASLELRNEESGDRLDQQTILLLLDRAADVFIAGTSGADGWLIKPLDAGRVQLAAAALADGSTWHEGSTSTVA